jgi:hypothetical protein
MQIGRQSMTFHHTGLTSKDSLHPLKTSTEDRVASPAKDRKPLIFGQLQLDHEDENLPAATGGTLLPAFEHKDKCVRAL